MEIGAQPSVHGGDITPIRTSAITQAQTRPQRKCHPLVHIQDFVCNVVYATNPHLSPLDEPSLGISHLISYFISYDKFSSFSRVFLASITAHVEHQYYS